MGSSPTSSDAELLEAVRDAMEDAAIRGLCREGQIEIGIDTALRFRPEWDRDRAAALVDTIENS